MKGSFTAPLSQTSRTEIFSENALITVFSEDCDRQQQESKSLQFARQIAALKDVQSFNDAFYVMDMSRVSQLIDQWVCSLPRVQPFYSVNCNEDKVLLKLLAESGVVGFNCLSGQNLETALELASPEKLLYSNPMWTAKALKTAAAKDVQMLTFESARDLDRIMLHHPSAELLLHVCINTTSDDPNALIGCDLDSAPELLTFAANAGANVIGVSFNLGSGCGRASLYASAVEISAGLIALGESLGLHINVLNIGSGFSAMDANFGEICSYINNSLDYYLPAEKHQRLRVLATPGRFFAGSAFSLCTSIVERRSVDLSNITNDDFDAGREAFVYQTNEGYYGGFGCRVNANIEPECVPLFDDYLDNFSAEHVYGTIVGPTLDSFDVVQSMCHFRPLLTGDWLFFNNMGAYSLNNRASLGDEDEHPSPVIFYFTSQSQWEQMEPSKKNTDYSSDSIPASPTHSTYGSDDDMACGDSISGDCFDEGFESGNFADEDNSASYGELKFLNMFGCWPLQE